MKTRLIFMLGLAMLLMSFVLHGQDDRINVYGTVCLADGSAVPGVMVTLTGEKISRQTSITNEKGKYHFFNIPVGVYDIKAELEGFKTVIRKSLRLYKGKSHKVDILMETCTLKEEVVVSGRYARPRYSRKKSKSYPVRINPSPQTSSRVKPNPMYGTFENDEYSSIEENQFKDPIDNPLSTFSIDVDTASYANTRRFIKQNSFPPKDAVRIEEFINYFSYEYPQPGNGEPFSIIGEVSVCPWNSRHLLAHIGLQGQKITSEDRIPSNLVFLLDVSGSMDDPLKLPLLKSAFKLLVNELTANDRVAIVVYAGAAGLVLPSTPGNKKDKIKRAIDSLSAGGSTAGGAGIQLAYRVALDNFIRRGNNRVILATDGDFNVGISNTPELVSLIEEKRKKHVFLTVLGFGMGNFKDHRMEQLADKGNGNYFYIDSLLEAKKVFINELGATLHVIAKDVKIQVEFNPAKVKAYKLVGYENRLLNKEDFDDDTKDAGELGAGHTVTALYEIIPAFSSEEITGAGGLKYQENKLSRHAYTSREIMTVKLRYKNPKGNKSKLIEVTVGDHVLKPRETTDAFRFSAAVAEFGLLLKDSKFKANASYESVLKLAKRAKGNDEFGYRAEFIQLVELCKLIAKSQ